MVRPDVQRTQLAGGMDETLPILAKPASLGCMSTMNISLPDALKEFVKEQVARRGCGTTSEYVRELIRKEQDRLHLRNLLLEGATSDPSGTADAAYFESLRDEVRRRTGT